LKEDIIIVDIDVSLCKFGERKLFDDLMEVFFGNGLEVVVGGG